MKIMLSRFQSFAALAFAVTLFVSAAQSQQIPSRDSTFQVVTYNVENLFDADQIALFDDYKSEKYKPRDLLTKLKNITRVLAQFNDGRGPEIVLFQEFEGDQTPSSSPFDYQRFIDQYKQTTVEQMLQGTLSAELRDLPAEAWLLKTLEDAGLSHYHVAVGEYRPDPTGRTVAHVNVTFSQFPIVSSTTHHTDGARGILEVVHDVGGYRLTTLNNHWKSGASNVEDEKIRLGNAQTLRSRLTQILNQDPSADVIIGGDFNSQYNQSKANPQMTQTAINDIAGSQGDELAIQKTGGPLLYNLWYELPVNRRGSDVYGGNWGTLMQMMITRGLYDFDGVQYVDNSFGVAALEGVNAQKGSFVPIAWVSIDGVSGGFSDHLPIYAKFRVARERNSNRFMSLDKPAVDNATSNYRPVDYLAVLNGKPPTAKSFTDDKGLRKIDHIGHVFLVESTVSGDFPFRIKIFEQEYTVWAFNEKFRVEMYKRYPVGTPMVFQGELGVHKGQWQFIVRDPQWLEVRP